MGASCRSFSPSQILLPWELARRLPACWRLAFLYYCPPWPVKSLVNLDIWTSCEKLFLIDQCFVNGTHPNYTLKLKKKKTLLMFPLRHINCQLLEWFEFLEKREWRYCLLNWWMVAEDLSFFIHESWASELICCVNCHKQLQWFKKKLSGQRGNYISVV